MALPGRALLTGLLGPGLRGCTADPWARSFFDIGVNGLLMQAVLSYFGVARAGGLTPMQAPGALLFAQRSL
jgi:hypothetical protein